MKRKSKVQRKSLVEIRTRYLGQNQYEVTVVADGVVEEILPCHGWNVAGMRNRACEYWSGHADQVTADGIPGAVDMRRAGDPGKDRP